MKEQYNPRHQASKGHGYSGIAQLHAFEQAEGEKVQPQPVEQPSDPERPILPNEQYMVSLLRQVFPERHLPTTVQIRMFDMYMDFLIARNDGEIDLAIRRAKHDPAFTEGDQNHKDIDTLADHLINSGLRQPPVTAESIAEAAHVAALEKEFDDIVFDDPSRMPLKLEPPLLPWLLEPSIDGKAPTPKINPDFYRQASKRAIELAYGRMRGEADLSPFGRAYLANIQDAFKRFNDQMIESDGDFGASPSVIDMTVEEYLAKAKEVLDDPREYEFLADQVEKLYERIGKTWQRIVELDTQGIAIPSDFSDPRHRTKKHWS